MCHGAREVRWVLILCPLGRLACWYILLQRRALDIIPEVGQRLADTPIEWLKAILQFLGLDTHVSSKFLDPVEALPAALHDVLKRAFHSACQATNRAGVLLVMLRVLRFRAGYEIVETPHLHI